jgi:hypothetical protein
MIQDVLRILQPTMVIPPYGQAVRDTIVELVNRITAIEAARGEIARTERSALAGLSEPDWRGLEERLTRML